MTRAGFSHFAEVGARPLGGEGRLFCCGEQLAVREQRPGTDMTDNHNDYDLLCFNDNVANQNDPSTPANRMRARTFFFQSV